MKRGVFGVEPGFVRAPDEQHAGWISNSGGVVVSSVNSALLNYLSAQSQGSATASATTANSTAGAAASKAGTTVPKAALDRAAGMAKSVSAARALEANQKTLATDLRAAMAKAGVKLGGAIEFSVKSDGSVETKGSEADKAAVKAFLSADTHQPSFATRIASQAKDALKLSATIQQSAAISQAAKSAKTSGGVMSLYNSFMQQTATTNVVFSVSTGSSALTYPGSLTTHA